MPQSVETLWDTENNRHWNRKTSPSSCRCQAWTRQWTVSPSFRLPEASVNQTGLKKINKASELISIRQLLSIWLLWGHQPQQTAQNQTTTSWQRKSWNNKAQRSKTSRQEGNSKAKVIAFSNPPLTWKALPICLNVSCSFKRHWRTHWCQRPFNRLAELPLYAKSLVSASH